MVQSVISSLRNRLQQYCQTRDESFNQRFEELKKLVRVHKNKFMYQVKQATLLVAMDDRSLQGTRAFHDDVPSYWNTKKKFQCITVNNFEEWHARKFEAQLIKVCLYFKPCFYDI